MIMTMMIMRMRRGLVPGVAAALVAALLFGASTPLAKLLLHEVGPWMLAGLFYFGSGIGLMVFRWLRQAEGVPLEKKEAAWFAGAIFFGGVVAPILLLWGLSNMPASSAALLQNAEGVFTALLAWFAFRENFDRRIALGMAAIATGAVILSWPEAARFAGAWPMLAVLGACLAWGIDNNLTRKVSLSDATWIASIKGIAAGCFNLMLAFFLGERLPALPTLMVAMSLGFLSFGVSLTLFVIGLRHLGTARTGAYFSVAPFFGAVLALAVGEPITLRLLVAGVLMAFGVWLHLTERHEHPHVHESLEHTHEHEHDEHHHHDHDGLIGNDEKHRHFHRHEFLVHTHPHFPDAHHRHRHLSI
ncbi:Permease of the drug/metabolite transporter (DMT) superfamily [Gammaproteobacteria bacterium]